MAVSNLTKEYVSLMSELTEAPEQYHLFMFYVMLGVIVAKRAHVATPLPMYPNFFVVLVGESGQTRKTTAMRLMRLILRKVKGDEVGWISHIGSLEGIYEYLISKPTTIIAPEEFIQLIKKSEQGHGGNLLPGLTELYDTPPTVQRILAQRMYEVPNPFVSIVTGTTKAWLEKMKEEDIYAGFGNRFIYVVGESEKVIPFPEKFPYPRAKPIIDALKQIDKAVRMMAERAEGSFCYEFEDGAKSYYEKFYRRFKAQLDYGVASAAVRRIDDYIKKIAMLEAIASISSRIKETHIQTAVSVGKTLLDDTLRLFSTMSKDRFEKLEAHILEMVRSNPGITRAKLLKDPTYKAWVGDKERVLNALIRAGILIEKRRHIYEA